MTDIKCVGRSSPLGATVVEGGVNFSLFSRAATGVELLFFDREDNPTPPQDIVPWQTAPILPDNTYRVGPHSVVMLFTGFGTGPPVSERL